MGRERRPVHERGTGGDDDAAPQARPAAGDRDGAPCRLPPRLLSLARAARQHKVTLALARAFVRCLAALKPLLGGYLRPSLRRRLALTLAGTSIVGYVFVATALWFILRGWSSLQGPYYNCFTPGLYSGTECGASFTAPIEVLFMILVPTALVLAGWSLLDRGPAARAAIRDRGDRPPAWPAEPRAADPDDRSRRPAEESGRRHRRGAGPAGCRVRRPAPVRRQRLTRAAHPARRATAAHRGGDGQPGGGRRSATARLAPAPYQ